MTVIRALSAVSIAAVSLALAKTAHAANSRVVVAGPENDVVASGLAKELTAMGFAPVRVDDAAGCSQAAIEARVTEAKAAAAACSDGTAATVWIGSKKGLRVAEVVTPKEGAAGGDVVAVRAAEITRASLELAASEPDEAPKPAPTPARNPAPLVPDADAATPVPLAPRTPKVILGMGISGQLGADASAVGFDAEAELRIARYLALAARADITFDGATIATPAATLRVAPSIVGMGAVVPLAATDSFFIPRLGAGAGVVWLRSSLATGPLATTFGAQDTIVSPAAYGTAAASLRVGGPLRVTLEGLLGTTAHRMVVRASGQDAAYWDSRSASSRRARR